MTQEFENDDFEDTVVETGDLYSTFMYYNCPEGELYTYTDEEFGDWAWCYTSQWDYYCEAYPDNYYCEFDGSDDDQEGYLEEMKEYLEYCKEYGPSEYYGIYCEENRMKEIEAGLEMHELMEYAHYCYYYQD